MGLIKRRPCILIGPLLFVALATGLGLMAVYLGSQADIKTSQ